MTTTTRCCILILSAVIVAVTAQDKSAIAVVYGPSGVTGNITFTQERSNKIKIYGKVIGLTKGPHGFHIHEKGDLSNGCASTGSHFNPDKKNHGSPDDRERHVGDLGNIEADDQGVALINIVDERVSLSGTKRNILGRAVVIHSDGDDYGRGGASDSLTTGHAGSRVACGVIGTLNASESNVFSTPAVTIFAASILAIVSPYLR